MSHTLSPGQILCVCGTYHMKGRKRIVFFQDSKCLTSTVIDEWSAQAEEAYRKAAGERTDSTSALPESMKCCKKRWGISEKFTGFGLPLGVVVYMPNGAIMLCAIVWVLSSISSSPVE